MSRDSPRETHPEAEEDALSGRFRHGLWQHYTVFDGLAGMRVEDLHQDGQGFLWVATADGGVSRFDGVHFDNLTVADGLPHPAVTAIAEDGEGRLWFGTLGGGVAVYDGQGFEVYTLRDGLPSGEILGLRFGEEGTMWVLTTAGLAGLREGRCVEVVRAVDGRPLGPVYDRVTDVSGTVWLATWGQGMISLEGRRLGLEDPRGRELDQVWGFAQEPSGRIWIAAPYTGADVLVFGYDPRTQRLDRLVADGRVEGGAVPQGVRQVRVDRQGWVWLAHRGIVVFDGVRWHRLARAGETFSSTRLTYEDREGNLWIGLWGGGLALCDFRSVQRYTAADGLPEAEVTSLAADAQGRLWIGTLGGLAYREEGRIVPMPLPPGVPTMVLALAVDRQGQVWAGSDRGRVFRGDAEGMVERRIAGEEAKVECLWADPEGRMWAGTSRGVWGRIEEKGLAAVPGELTAVKVLLQDRGGRFWLGSYGYAPVLHWYDGGRFQAPPGIDPAQLHYVDALYEDAEGTMWIGTGTGLLAWRETGCRRFTTADGLSANGVLSLAADGQGRLWIGTGGGGVLLYDGQGFRVMRLGTTALANMVEAIHCEASGQVWLGTRAGLVVYGPGSTPPGLVIRQVSAGRLFREPRAVECVETVPEIRIVFQGIEFRTGIPYMRYRWRLTGPGQGGAWSPFTREQEVVYTHLPVGEYGFEVQAMDPDGLCSPSVHLGLAVTPDPRNARLRTLEGALGTGPEDGEFIGQSAAFGRVREELAQVAETEITVLILGETGTGKGLAARLLHAHSPRRAKPFIPLNCSTLAPGVRESELFGHEKGAFTGAVGRQLGWFEVAEGGTLFLDEIGDLPPEAQGLLLQVLEEKQVQRVGGRHAIQVDVRLVAATNRDLEQEVQAGRFRGDLFYRLNTFVLHLPPLRQRREDIPLLWEYFVGREARRLQKPAPSTDPEVRALLESYSWPGNVRELEHLAQRAVVVGDGASLTAADLPRALQPGSASFRREEWVSLAEYERQAAEAEKGYLLQALDAREWVVYGEGGAAALLGIHPEKLRARMKRLGLQRPCNLDDGG